MPKVTAKTLRRKLAIVLAAVLMGSAALSMLASIASAVLD